MLIAAIATPALAQTRAADFTWSGTASAGRELSVGNINGDIKITPSTTGKVEVLGFKRGDSQYFDRIRADVQQTSRGIVVCVLYDDASYCDDNGSHSDRRRGDRDWGNVRMDLQVAVPTTLEVSASTVSGDVDVTGAHGNVRANSVSGDIHLDRLHASSIRANTVSGDVEVRVDEFTGDGDLSFNSVSGDITLEAPRNFGADIAMSSISGDVNSDFPLTVGSSRSMRRGGMEARVGNGGRRLEFHTVSGNLRLRSID